MTTEPLTDDERLAAAFADLKAVLAAGERVIRRTPPPWFLIMVTAVPWMVFALFGAGYPLFALITVLGLWAGWFIARRRGR